MVLYPFEELVGRHSQRSKYLVAIIIVGGGCRNNTPNLLFRNSREFLS